jgi:hypothetical protein
MVQSSGIYMLGNLGQLEQRTALTPATQAPLHCRTRTAVVAAAYPQHSWHNC